MPKSPTWLPTGAPVGSIARNSKPCGAVRRRIATALLPEEKTCERAVFQAALYGMARQSAVQCRLYQLADCTATMNCRPQCGACCTAPSITSPIPGMPSGKPSGVKCIQLGEDNRCLIFGKPERPAFCAGLQPSEDMCGTSREMAIRWLNELEYATSPD